MAAKKQSEKADVRQADTPETPESQTEVREAAASVLRSGDRVAAVSYRKDGTPDQSDDYKVIGQD